MNKLFIILGLALALSACGDKPKWEPKEPVKGIYVLQSIN